MITLQQIINTESHKTKRYRVAQAILKHKIRQRYNSNTLLFEEHTASRTFKPIYIASKVEPSVWQKMKSFIRSVYMI